MKKDKVLRIIAMLSEIDSICESANNCGNCPLYRTTREGFPACDCIDWRQVYEYKKVVEEVKIDEN